MSLALFLYYTLYELYTYTIHTQAARLSTLSCCHKLIQESTPPYTLSEAETRIHTKNRPQMRTTMEPSTNQHHDYNTRKALKTQTILQQRANTLASYPTTTVTGHNSDPHPEHPETTSDNDENDGPNHTNNSNNNNNNGNNNNNDNSNSNSNSNNNTHIPHPSSHNHIHKDPSVRSLQDLHRHPSHMSWLVYI